MTGARASVVPGMLLLLLLLLSVLLCLNPATGQGVYFTEVQAGNHIDSVSVAGMQVAGFLRGRFMPVLDALMARLDAVEQSLVDELGVEYLPNLTAQMDSYLVNVTSALDAAEALVQSLNLTDMDAGQAAYFKHGGSLVNVQEPMVDGKFLVPQSGVYMINLSPYQSWYGSQTQLMLNGNETLAEVAVAEYNYYQISVRVVLRWLNKGDEVYTTGDTPAYFGVNLLRLQSLMP